MKVFLCFLITVNFVLPLLANTPARGATDLNPSAEDQQQKEKETDGKKEIRKRGAFVGGYHTPLPLPRVYASHFGHSYGRTPTTLKTYGGVRVKSLTPLLGTGFSLPSSFGSSVKSHFLHPGTSFVDFNYAPQFFHRPAITKPLVATFLKPLSHFTPAFTPSLHPVHGYQPHITPSVLHVPGHPTLTTTGTVDCPPVTSVSHLVPQTQFTTIHTPGTTVFHPQFPTVPFEPVDPLPGIAPVVPELPQIPSIPNLPAVPALPALPTFPELPTLPSLPQPPTLPEIPAVLPPVNHGFVSSHFQPPLPQQPPLFFNVIVPVNKKPDITPDIAPAHLPVPAPLPEHPHTDDVPAPPPLTPQFEPHPVYGPPVSTQQPSHTLLPPHGVSSPDNAYLPPANETPITRTHQSLLLQRNLNLDRVRDAELNQIFSQSKQAHHHHHQQQQHPHTLVTFHHHK